MSTELLDMPETIPHGAIVFLITLSLMHFLEKLGSADYRAIFGTHASTNDAVCLHVVSLIIHVPSVLFMF